MGEIHVSKWDNLNFYKKCLMILMLKRKHVVESQTRVMKLWQN